jgi:hypothetical protein
VLIVSNTYKVTWDSDLPLKIQVFLWLIQNDRLLTKQNMGKRGWLGDQLCSFCHQAIETVDHLFVTCDYFQQIWHWI